MYDLAEKIYKQALNCGFDKCGVISMDALEGFDELYDNRLKDVPISQHFYKSVGELKQTRERFPWARSIVILAFDYGKFRFPKELQGKYGKAFFLEPEKGSKNRYDLERLEEWFCENDIRAEGGEHFGAVSVGPLRYIATKAGLGIIRKNNFFYTEKGSYNNLYGYVIDKDCELIQECDMMPCSDKCNLCRKACKSGALEASYTMNPFRCISFLTTFGNSDVPEGLTDEMYEEWVCGCDNCQDACPYNIQHDWSKGKHLKELEAIATDILPENYDELTDEYLIRNVIPKTSNHLQDKDIIALRKNAARSVANSKKC